MILSEYEIQKVIAEKYDVETCDVILKSTVYVSTTPICGKEYYSEIRAVILTMKEDE